MREKRRVTLSGVSAANVPCRRRRRKVTTTATATAAAAAAEKGEEEEDLVSNRIAAIPAGINMHDVKVNKRILRRRNEARKRDGEERRRIALLFHSLQENAEGRRERDSD